MGAIVLFKALAVGFLIGFSVVGLSKAAIAALPAPSSIPAVTQAASAAHHSLDRRIAPVSQSLWRAVDGITGARAEPRLQ